MHVMNPDSGLLQRVFSSPHTTTLLSFFSWAIQLAYGVIVLATILCLLFNITKLAKSAGNPAERSRALSGILASCVCLAALGGIGILFILVLSFMA